MSTTADVRHRLADEIPQAVPNGQYAPANRAARRRSLTPAELSERRGAWTVAELLELPVTVDLATAGSVLGLGLTKARELVRAGEFPVRVIKHGDRYVVPVRPLLVLLGLGETPAA